MPNTWIISPTGDDITGTGTVLNPFKTLDGPTIGLGDTVLCRGGNYTFSYFNNAQNKFIYGTSEAERITIGAYESEVPVVVTGGSFQWQFKNDVKFFSIKNIFFDGVNQSFTSPDGLLKIYGDVTAKLPKNCVISGNTFQKGARENVQLFMGSNSTIENNTSIDAGRDPASNTPNLFYITGNDLIVRKNKAIVNTNQMSRNFTGIRVYTNAGGMALKGPSTNNIIEQNYVTHCTNGIVAGAGNNNIVRSNIVANPLYTGGNLIEIISQGSGGSTDNTKVYNNSLWGNGAGIGVWLFASGATITNTKIEGNIFHQLTTNVNIGSATGTTQVSNYTTDPLFINQGGLNQEDYYLQATSGALNGAPTLAEVPNDIVGSIRPQGVGPDFGAYELPVSPPMGSGGLLSPQQPKIFHLGGI